MACTIHKHQFSATFVISHVQTEIYIFCCEIFLVIKIKVLLKLCNLHEKGVGWFESLHCTLMYYWLDLSDQDKQLMYTWSVLHYEKYFNSSHDETSFSFTLDLLTYFLFTKLCYLSCYLYILVCLENWVLTLDNP